MDEAQKLRERIAEAEYQYERYSIAAATWQRQMYGLRAQLGELERKERASEAAQAR